MLNQSRCYSLNGYVALSGYHWNQTRVIKEMFWTRNESLFFFFFKKLRVYIATTCVSDVPCWSGKHKLEKNLLTQDSLFPCLFLVSFIISSSIDVIRLHQGTNKHNAKLSALWLLWWGLFINLLRYLFGNFTCFLFYRKQKEWTLVCKHQETALPREMIIAKDASCSTHLPPVRENP